MFYHPHPRVHPPHDDDIVTIQSAKDQCDINMILAQYRKTGILTHVQQARPSYEDLPDVQDYQAALGQILEAEAAFRALPSAVRSHWNNSPEAFLSAFGDSSQADKLREFGLLKPLASPPPTPSE